MPISTKLGVGAVVSCLCHYLKPRDRAQSIFGQEYALGRAENLLVEALLPAVGNAVASCRVLYRGPLASADPQLNVFAITCGSVKVTTPAAADQRVQVAARMPPQLRIARFLTFLQVAPRHAAAPRAHPNVAAQRAGHDEDAGYRYEDDDGELSDLDDAFDLENADAQADFAVGATFSAEFGHDGVDCRRTGAREHVEPYFPPTLRNFRHDLSTATASQWLFHWFPFEFWSETCLLATKAQNPELELIFLSL
jgi:hypothetical protein